MKKDSKTIVDPFSYKDNSTPDGYKCDYCGTSGVRLYREYQTFLNHQKLSCRACTIKDQGKEPEIKSEHMIGWKVAAVPTEDGETFWGYTSVPQVGVEWWNNLPCDKTTESNKK